VKLFLKSIILIGVALSSVAAFYSIGGLVLIFKGSPISIIILASLLECAKVLISVYLHIFWHKAKKLLIAYLTFALIILATITSLGIFGALSSAYFNSTDTSEYILKINNIKAKIEIENNRITNINAQIAAISNIPKEDKQNWHYWKINSLSKEIKTISDNIDKLNDEMIPYKTKINMINSEVGPLKYLAEWIYGENENSIDKAVQLFIVMLVVVFDPLALLLIFAGIHGIHIIENEEKIKEKVEIPKEISIKNKQKKKNTEEIKKTIKDFDDFSVNEFEKQSVNELEKQDDEFVTNEEVEEALSELDKQLKKIRYIK